MTKKSKVRADLEARRLEAKLLYIMQGRSLAEAAKEAGIGYTNLKRLSKEQGWPDQRVAHKGMVADKVAERVADQEATLRAQMLNLTSGVIARAVEYGVDPKTAILEPESFGEAAQVALAAARLQREILDGSVPDQQAHVTIVLGGERFAWPMKPPGMEKKADVEIHNNGNGGRA